MLQMETYGASRVARHEAESDSEAGPSSFVCRSPQLTRLFHNLAAVAEKNQNKKKNKKPQVLIKTRWSASWERHANTHVLSVRRPSLTSTPLAIAL